MRTYFLLTTQAICLCLVATFFVTELTGITNGGVVGGWCASITLRTCNGTVQVKCQGSTACTLKIDNCEGNTGDLGICSNTSDNACSLDPNCNINVRSCICNSSGGQTDGG
jgi:hypothetical protein